MSTAKFPDLALLWPFANELDQTFLVYNEPRIRAYEQTDRPLNDSIAMVELSAALGHIAMDNSMPQFHLIGHRKDALYKKGRGEEHLIYIGGGIHNQAVREFLDKCNENGIKRRINLPSKVTDPRLIKLSGDELFKAEYYHSKLLFTIGQKYKKDLENGSFPESLHQVFEDKEQEVSQVCQDKKLEVSQKATVSKEQAGWLITYIYSGGKYFIEEAEGMLNVYREDVKTDYGLILLTRNPFAGAAKFRVLLVAGLHSYGTLAAAEFAARPNLSTEIVRRIIANFHIPPHLLGTVEVLIEADVGSKGQLRNLGKDNVKAIFVNEQSIPFELFVRRRLKRTIKCTAEIPVEGGKTESLVIKRENATSKQLESNPAKLKRLLRIDFSMELGSSGVAAPMKKEEADKILSNDFFTYFSKRPVVVVSPHSDDSVIACGGLIYYLRNKELWAKRRSESERPPVSVLVVTESPRGAKDYLRDYCNYVGLYTVKPDVSGETIRFNENCAESLLLDTDSHWLAIDRSVGQTKNEKTIIRKLRDILGPYKDYTPLFLVPNFGDEHETHKYVTRLTIGTIRNLKDDKALPKLKDAEIWLYESPWGALDPADINVIIPLDRHAMFAKCQAISMHQSQVTSTQYSDAALTHNRNNAEVLGGLIHGHATEKHDWGDYLEVFSSRVWLLEDYSLKSKK